MRKVMRYENDVQGGGDASAEMKVVKKVMWRQWWTGRVRLRNIGWRIRRAAARPSLHSSTAPALQLCKLIRSPELRVLNYGRKWLQRLRRSMDTRRGG